MSKHPTKRSACEVVLPQPAERLTIDVLDFLVDARQGLWTIAMKAGLETLRVRLEDDRRRLCGPKGRPDPEREATRCGYDDGSVVLGGRRVSVRKPRVRTVAGEEVVLPTYQRFNRDDPLSHRALEPMILGGSTRSYGRSLEPVEAPVEETATRKSSVSRRFVARTQAQLEAFLTRPLGNRNFPILTPDGKGFGDHTLVIALGVDADGRKEVLGVAEGSTENEAVCRRLLADLVDRGLPVERARLFVIDGGKGLRKAIRAVFGDWALVHRGHVHKIRNVLEHLPEGKRVGVRAAMRQAYGSGTPALAKRRLLDLARSLAPHPGAVASLQEGLEKTLTLLGLAPRERSSGTARHLGAISKRGNTYLRMLLIHGARSVLCRTHRSAPRGRLRTWAATIEARRGHNKATVALANKLARIAYAVWKHDAAFKEEHFAATSAT